MTKRVVVITGGASGHRLGGGRAVRQARLVGRHRRQESRTRARTHSVTRSADMESVVLDVTSTQSVEMRYLMRSRRVTGGSMRSSTAPASSTGRLSRKIDWGAWNSVIDVNLTGTLRCLQAAGRQMLQQGSGAIVNLSSVAGVRGVPGRTPYAASKAGVEAVTRSAAVEWARAGIRVNAVAPGYVESEMVEEYVKAGQASPLGPILARIPMRRLAKPCEIADLIYYLCSEQSSYITGQVIAVDGGFLADYGVAPPEASPGS